MAYSSIAKPTDYFNTKLTTGTGSSQAVTGVGFQPDWIWGKRRDSSGNNSLFDSVRGITKGLESNSTGAEFTSTDYYSSFDSDGFTIAAGSSGAGNGSSQTAVQWCWKAGNSSGSSNTAGDINSTVSVNTTAGFSIVSYTGNGSTNQTVGHGLGSVPDFIIIKQRNTTRNWPTYTKALGNGVAFLDINDAWNGGSGYTNYWYLSGMTSTTFGISNNDNNNASGGTYIAYCFAAKKGYSKFGTYTGNNDADGTFVYTGFRPKFIVTKPSNLADNWQIIDGVINPFNTMDTHLFTNLNASAQTTSSYNFDMYSNGFKGRTNNSAYNGAYNYLFIAFAANPFVANDSGTAVPVTAL
tara:strand:+ start:877 stop:1935 length:1059 start_codon:yes stop_codon:yes gene_type:complete